MIAFINGTIASYSVDSIVVDHNGIGLKIAYPHCDQISLNQSVHIYTYMHLTENDVSLFGFESQEEKDLFLRLISVKGLGPKTAMNMLAKAGYDAIIQAIESGDLTALRKLPGIGAKSASQIVLDLKGKLVQSQEFSRPTVSQKYPQEISDALEGLKNLGYRSGELTAVGNMLMDEPGLTVKEYLKKALQFLQKQRLGGN